MTKKDYILIAEPLRTEYAIATNNYNNFNKINNQRRENNHPIDRYIENRKRLAESTINFIEYLQARYAAILYKDNDRFDEEKWKNYIFSR